VRPPLGWQLSTSEANNVAREGDGSYALKPQQSGSKFRAVFTRIPSKE
jgi:hypothetical protein